MWIRTKKTSFNFGDYTNLDTDSWDALKFKAKRDVLFCGIGMLKNWESKAFVLEMKYRIVSADEEEGATTQIEVDSVTSPENEEKTHWFDIQNYD